MNELAVLQTVRLKGRTTRKALAEHLGADLDATSGAVGRLVDAGFLVDDTALRLSSAGRARLDDLLAGERKTVDAVALDALYKNFCVVNTDFKVLLAQWQLGRLDADAVVEALKSLHSRVPALIADVAVQVPRLAEYARRLDVALSKITAGDMGWLSRPLIDSYHTVWFELHEELLGATGRIRDEDG